jgi:hypothetical protein
MSHTTDRPSNSQGTASDDSGAKILRLDAPDPGREAETVDRRKPQKRGDGRLTGSAAFFLILVVTALSCSVGFLLSGATFIPIQASWGLVVASLLAALLVREQDKAVALWSPPLAMGVAIAALGQVTLLGTTPTATLETSMFLTAMASSAPFQLAAVVGSFVVLRWRFSKRRKNRITLSQ